MTVLEAISLTESLFPWGHPENPTLSKGREISWAEAEIVFMSYS